MQNGTGGHLEFRITKIQGQEMLYHRNDIECDSIDPQNTRNHLMITLSQIIKMYSNCLWRLLWILDLRDPRSKLYTDIQYEIILLHQLQKPFIKQHIVLLNQSK